MAKSLKSLKPIWAILVPAIVVYSQFLFGQDGEVLRRCPNGIRRTPASSVNPLIHEIKMIGNNEPLCLDDFIQKMNLDKLSAKSQGDTDREELIETYIQTAKTAPSFLRRIECRASYDGNPATYYANTVFLTPTVYGATAHTFYEKVPNQDVHGANIDPYNCKVADRSGLIGHDRSIAPVFLGDLKGTRSISANDSAAAAIEKPISGFKPPHIFNPSEIEEGKSILMLLSAYVSDPLRPHLKNCYSVVICSEELKWPTKSGNKTTWHKSTCSIDSGGSNSAVMLVKKSPGGHYVSGLVGIADGSVDYVVDEKTGQKQFLPDGTPYNRGSMYSSFLELTGLAAKQINEVLRQTNEGTLEERFLKPSEVNAASLNNGKDI